MERSQLFDLMGELKLYGMKVAFDEIMATAVKRQHEPQRIVGDLLNAEISEKQARSIKYQLTIAKLPLAKDLADFRFEGTPINETLVHDLAGGGFIAQRNAVLVGGTGTGKTHLAIAIFRPRQSRPSGGGSCAGGGGCIACDGNGEDERACPGRDPGSALASMKPRNGASWSKEGRVWCGGVGGSGC